MIISEFACPDCKIETEYNHDTGCYECFECLTSFDAGEAYRLNEDHEYEVVTELTPREIIN